MNQLTNRLTWLEKRLQSAIEGSAARLFPDSNGPLEFSKQLISAMQRGSKKTSDGTLTAPDVFILLVHPDQVNILQGDPVLLDELAEILMQLGIEAGYSFSSSPSIRIATNSGLKPGEIRVATRTITKELGQTAAVDVAPPEGGSPENAFLIVDGTQIFLLTQPIVNIGRNAENHLVISDARVSRLHAQMRLSKGRYVIFDLGSAGGTRVNGERVQQWVLYPGDVITLAGFPLVYGQENVASGDTQDLHLPNLDDVE